MNDPFFDEDDGEFDDLYGDPPPTASSPAAQRKPRNSPSPAAQPLTPGGRPSSHRSAASSSVVSRSYARDRAASNATEQDKRRRKRGKARRKDSQELFDVQWQSDVAVSRCGLCSADFSLVRRKHHCRHCGRVMCSDCSSFLFFEFSNRKHRVCSTCNEQLLTEQDAYDRETLGNGQHRDTTSNLVDDSSEDAEGRSNLRTSLVNAFTPKHNNEEERAKKKQEKKEKKEQKQREKLQKKGKAAPDTTRISRRQVVEVEEKKAANGAALFDGADDEWFSDVPGQRSRSQGSGDSEEGVGSKGPGWRDRVKDTYTVTPATEKPSVLVPMAGGTLTAGITGKGYISDQFRYDNVGGPGLGHDDDSSVEMPRPKQQPATMTYTGHSAKPSQLTGNGYFSEQFQYDDVGGPGLGHDDDRAVAMPRPKQQAVATPYSYDGVQPSGTRSEHDATDDNVRYEQEFEPRITFKENLKDIFSGTKRRESTLKKNEKKIRTTGSKPRARGNQSMTLDELNPSYSSEDEPRLLASAMPRPTLTPAQPTFYDDEADKLVVDDSPGFFEATIAEREAQRQKEEEQQKQLAKDTAWVNGSALPPTVPSHRFSSEQDSYSIVDPPSHTSNSPVENQRRSRTAGDGVGNNGNSKGGFTGALKRFFGMGSKATEKATTPPRPATVPPDAVAAPPEKDGSEQNLAKTNTSQLDITTREQATRRLERHTVMDYYADSQEVPAPQENVRFTMAGYVDSQETPSRFDTSVPSQISGPSQTSAVAQQKLERKRRGTFDDLFESPKTSVPSDRYSSTGATEWTATAAVAADRASYGASAVGVARFDQRRSIDEAEAISLGAGPQSAQPPARSLNDSAEAWRQPTALSLLYDRVDVSQSEGSGFTWSNVRSVPGLGTATYAMPTSLQPRTVYGENHESPNPYDVSAAQSAPLGSIMDDLKRSSTLKKSPGKDPVDDFFAEFEEPNDYVFDPTTGGYVAARVPPRAVAARPVSRSESTELEAPQAVPEMVASRGSGHEYYAPSESNVRPTARTGISKDQGVEEVDDEVAEIIVDKISSLESELAALKQLIRSRKGGGGNSQVAKPHNSATRSSARKASIFDNDSSDEEENGKPGGPYATSVQPPSRQEGRHRPGSKKKHVKKRKDSFADLFEDIPNEVETLGGASSYEALFQTGTTRPGASHEEGSDDDAELTAKPTKARSKKSRRRSSRKINDFVATKVDSDSEPEFASLKGRRGKQSSRRDISNDANGAGVELITTKSGDQLVTPLQVDVIPVLKPVNKQVEEEDPIDALFASDDHDVAKLYGGDNANFEEDTSSVVEPQSTNQAGSELFTQTSSTSLTDGEESGSTSAVATNANSVVPINREPSGHIHDISAQGLDEADEEEDFAINWAKMRKTKSRRRKSHRDPSDSTVNPDESIAADNTTDDHDLEPSLLGSQSDVEVVKNDVRADRKDTPAPVPSAFLADAASNWMSVSTLEDESVNLSLTVDEDLSSPLGSMDEGKIIELSLESAPTRREPRDDESGLKPVVVSTDLAEPGRAAELSISTKETESSGNSDDPVGDLSHSELSFMEVNPESAKTEPPRESDATFDIFDKSGDVDFLSVTAPMDLKIVDHEGEGVGSENDDRESFPEEENAFSFEIKAPKKRASALGVNTSDAVSEEVELSPPSPSSSTDDNVELGKYASSSVPSSTTPSVDGSVDDPEDVAVDDESVLGKVESQAFDSDWNQMQAKEKERKKRLQAKQRQAQRDKVLRKQGVSSKALTGASTPHSSSKSKSKSGKKKKKDKEKDGTVQSSHHKKSGSSRKHRHRENGDADSATPSEPPRSLTEL